MNIHRLSSYCSRSLFRLIPFVLTGAICASGQNSSAGQDPPKQPAQDEAPHLFCSVGDGFTLAAVGDLIFSGPLSKSSGSGLTAVVAILRDADATFGNLENTLIDLRSFRGYPQAESGGGHLSGSPNVAREMRNMGFNLVARANNHTTDWGIEGMRETDNAADAAGLVHAGTGDNRAAARAARFMDTSKGRIGLVSLATTFTPMSVATAPVGEAPGRPGLSALRLKRFAIVTTEMMEGLRKIREAQPPDSLLVATGAQPKKPGDLELFGVRYRAGNHAGRSTYEMNGNDLREILKSIRQGKESSDFLVATVHGHEPGNWADEPPDFMPDLAHASINAGADAFVVHGPHRLRGIEIYKGRPIFYSLGNFVFQAAVQEPFPMDVYEAFKVDPATSTDAELSARIIKINFDEPVWYESIIAVCRFERGELSEVRLYPIDLNYSARTSAQGGIPRLAAPPLAEAILERIQKLSQPFGTKIDIVGNVGVVRLHDSSGMK